MCGRLALSFQDCSRVSLGSAEPESGFTTNLVRIFGVDCVYGGEKIGYPELPFCCRFLGVFFPPPEISRTWLKFGTRNHTDLLSFSQQTSLTLPVDSSRWVWLLPFPLNSTHNPCFCQPASAFSFTCWLPARRNGAGGTPWRASRIFRRSPGLDGPQARLKWYLQRMLPPPGSSFPVCA